MSADDRLRRRAEHFARLHGGPSPVIIPNAWDALSARLLEAGGFGAVATTSAGIAWTLGYPDGQRLPLREHVRVLSRIAGSVAVPVSADLEAGYASTPEATAAVVERVVRAGCVGVNLEDRGDYRNAGLAPPELHAERVRCARAAASAAGVPLFINARTDVFWRSSTHPRRRLGEAIGRLHRYVDAGADGVFVPGLASLRSIRVLVSEVPVPVNVLLGRGTPSLASLRDAGVARVTVGSGLLRLLLGSLVEAAERLRRDGRIPGRGRALPYDAVDDLVGQAFGRRDAP